MQIRLSPSFVVAVLALVLAAGATGYAAGKVTSAQIKNGTITAKDVKNGALTGGDVKDGSLGRRDLSAACALSEEPLFGGCVRRAATGPSSFRAAIDDCTRRNGRLPTSAELTWIAGQADVFEWADGNISQYEFTGDYTGASPFTPIAFDRAGNAIANASAQLFWHHCVTY